ncbi:MAG: hypothetical protein WDO18_12865 [Acidobacteriota bacterium]
MKDFDLYDDRSQSLRYIDRYPKSSRALRKSRSSRGRSRSLNSPDPLAGPPDRSTSRRQRQPRPRPVDQGDRRISTKTGSPLKGALVELWQANSAGKYIHEMDNHKAPVDSNFTGQGRLVTNEEGEYDSSPSNPAPIRCLNPVGGGVRRTSIFRFTACLGWTAT